MFKPRVLRFCLRSLVSGVLLLAPAMYVSAQEGLGERIGARIDKGLNQLGDEFRENWASLQRTVDNLGVQGRVYSRLRWDKQLIDSRLDVEVTDERTVSLTGRVKSDAIKEKAMQLAKDTVGVENVIDHLIVEKTGPLESSSTPEVLKNVE